MGRGTWYYSLGVFLAIVDAFVRSEFEISSWRGARVDVRTYLLGVPLSYESVDVVVGENWLLRHKAEMNRISYGISTRSDADLRRLVSFDVFKKARGGVRVARKDDRGVTEGREDVCEVFQQRGSGAKRKLSRCGRNQIGNEPILALPEGADDFVVYYDARSKDLKACLEKGRRYG
ncbi:hypothetical protein Tco_0887843 [Tanacetum coccineum]